MAVKKFKPTTPGQRHKIIGVFKREEFLGVDAEGKNIVRKTTANAPEKSLTVGKRSTGGRNTSGELSTRYRGGGHKRKLRLIDFKRNYDDVEAVVKSIEYDPNRSARIALLYYVDGSKAYIIAPNGLEVGQKVISGEDVAPEVGNSLPAATKHRPMPYSATAASLTDAPACQCRRRCRSCRDAVGAVDISNTVRSAMKGSVQTSFIGRADLTLQI